MNKEFLKQYIKVEHFFKNYCPTVTNFSHKARGLNTSGKPLYFTEDDKVAIKNGMNQLCKDISSELERH